MLLVKPPDLGDGFGQADRHRGVVGVDEDIPLCYICAQICLPQAPESQLTDGIAQGTPHHATQEPGFQFYLVRHAVFPSAESPQVTISIIGRSARTAS